MARECSYILPTGRNCRCPATRNQALCRHHAPKPAVAGPPPLAKRDRYSRLWHWAELSRGIPWLEPSEIPIEIYSILYALLQDDTLGISDREAGRLLRGLLRRLGSVPFSMPDSLDMEPEAAQPAPRVLAAPPPSERKPAPPPLDPALFSSLLSSLERQVFGESPSTRPSLHQPQPTMTQPQPGGGQPRPTMNQPRPSYK
jgi:hypothetical protein